MARPDETETQSGEPEPVDAEFEAVDESEDAAAKPARRGPGWLLFIFTLLVTAVIAAAVAWALTRYVAPRLEGAPADTEALEQRLAAIEARLPEDGIGERVATLETRLSALSGLSDRVEELTGRVSGLEDAVAALEAAPAAEPGERPALPDNLAERLSQLETQAGQALQLARSLQEALTTNQDGGGADVSAALDRLRSDIESLRGRLTERAAAFSAEDEALAGALQSVGETVGELQVRLGDIADEAGQALELARNAQTGTGSETAQLRELSARALGLAALSEAASGSGPFEAERAALARVWRGQSDLAALESIARSGAPTRGELAERFPGEATREAAGGAQRFWGLVEVRPAEGAEGEGPSSIVARAERQLERGNLAGAVSAVEELEGDPAQAAADWLRGARARLEIERRLASLRSALSEAAATQEDTP